jgi:predicted enzyme related to lactoylglutathione lyase
MAKAKRKPPAKAAAKRAGPRKATRRTKQTDTPIFFRLNIEVGDLDKAAAFYGELFGVDGRKQAGSRAYIQAGPVTLQVVDVSPTAPHPAAKALYFTVKNLDAVHARAKKLGCLSRELVHGKPGGDLVTRPWGERSFYADDPWSNPLCFVEAGTTYPG